MRGIEPPPVSPRYVTRNTKHSVCERGMEESEGIDAM